MNAKKLIIQLCVVAVCILAISPITTAQDAKKAMAKTAEIKKADAEGMQFFEGTWAEAVAEAKKQNKPIFLDAYTSWCAPCKKMAKEVFPLEDVGSFYNGKYINVKMDMEKGEGIDMAKSYEIKNYPTFVFFDKEGNALHKSIGGRPADGFVALGENALETDKQFYTLQAKYESGGMSEEGLYNYVLASAEAKRMPDTKLADEYFATQKGDAITNDKNIDLVMQVGADADSKAFSILLDNKAKFIEKYETDVVYGFMSRALSNKVRIAAQKDDEKSYKEALDISNKHFGDFAGIMNDKLSSSYYQMTEDWAKFAKVAVSYLDNAAPEAWGPYNNTAWAFYEHVEEKALLEKAATWAKKSMEIEKNYYNSDTYAALLFKLGKKEEAIKAAEDAIKLAKENDLNPKETEAMLEKIKELK